MTCNYCNRNHLCPPRLFRTRCKPKKCYLDCLTFLCDDRGHLLPQVKQCICKKTNHWGYPVASIWDEDYFGCSDRCRRLRCPPQVCWQLEDMPRYFKCRPPLAECHDPNCSHVNGQAHQPHSHAKKEKNAPKKKMQAKDRESN